MVKRKEYDEVIQVRKHFLRRSKRTVDLQLHSINIGTRNKYAVSLTI